LGTQYSIGTVAAMTGLTQHAIRAWEKRHQVLSPTRTDSNHRTYDDADVERLKLLRDAIGQGHGISRAATMSNDELRSFIASHSTSPRKGENLRTTEEVLSECISAVDQLDELALRKSIVIGVTRFGVSDFIDFIVLPLIAITEQRWSEKSLSIAQEHLVSAVLRTNLEHLRSTIPDSLLSRRLMVTTPRGQMHELGALVISVIAGVEGWNVTYLGPNLPANEIVRAARQSHADAIGLSLVYPTDDQQIGEELKEVRAGLGSDYPIIVGGRAAAAYLAPLAELHMKECSSIPEFRKVLAEI
jgi:DNA-binding transcriptional MerR regulator/methylmalonyl-CoA mutase cobalamin-binding subunit